MATVQQESAPLESILSPRYRASTVGLLIVVTIIAFEAIAVATAMPTTVAALHGLAYYGWPFTAFMIANVVGIVAGGDMCDRGNPRRPLLAGLVIFIAGLLVAGLAPAMAEFVIGRAVQGLGGGLVMIALYVVIAEVYDARLRPKMFAAFSAGWVLPSLIGPVISGALAQHVSWRAVFLLIPPFALAGLVLMLPAARRLPDRPKDGAATNRIYYALLAAAGVAVLQYAGQQLRWLSVALLAVGLAMFVPGMRQLLPAGTVAARRGMPAVIALRGLTSGAFFAVDSYVPLTLTHLHGFSATTAGLPLMLGSIGWSAASWWQGRHTAVGRHVLIRTGCAVIVAGALLMAVVTMPGTPGLLSYLAWLLAGAGMGLVMPSVAVLLLEFSPASQRGRNSSALQICDVTSSAVTVGLGGVLVAAAESGRLGLGHALGLIDLAMAAVALLAGTLAYRARAVGVPH